MLKREIVYKDFEGNEQVETAYFNITKAELIKMEMSETEFDSDGNAVGGMSERLATIRQGTSGKQVMDTFEWIIGVSYGVRSEDGRRFIKSDELFNEFKQTMAYDQLFTELLTDADEAVKFVNAVLPAEVVNQVAEENRKEQIANNMRELGQ